MKNGSILTDKLDKLDKLDTLDKLDKLDQSKRKKVPDMPNYELWYPYTQMKTMSEPIQIHSAKGVYLNSTRYGPLIDAISSWWCVIHGYNHPELNQAMITQLQHISHVMLGGLTHQPAQKLAKELVTITPEGLNHVFFSDSGSVGCEVALKMAVQYWHNIGKPKKSKFLGLKLGYHGDTCGVMGVGDPEENSHSIFTGIVSKHLFVAPPLYDSFTSTTALNLALKELEQVFCDYHHQLAGFICEPLLQGAGGLNMYTPKYLNRVRELCDTYHILLIFDEVATGFGRTGTLFATNQTCISPDIMVLGKGLTGGYMGLAATLTTTPLFQSFFNHDPNKAFMHGPTFMGNPLACAVALKSIDLFLKHNYLSKIKEIERLLKEELLEFRTKDILHTRVMGATGVVEVYDSKQLNGITEFGLKRGVWLRPFRRVVYTMPPYIITLNECEKITSTIKEWFKQKEQK